MPEDPHPNIIGVWNRELKDVHSIRDFGLFYIYDSSWCYDEEGVSEIAMNELDNGWIKFQKLYLARNGVAGRLYHYRGQSNDGKVYRGQWFGSHADNYGQFVLTRVNSTSTDISEIEAMFGYLNHRVFYKRLTDKREGLPFSPLKESLKR